MSTSKLYHTKRVCSFITAHEKDYTSSLDTGPRHLLLERTQSLDSSWKTKNCRGLTDNKFLLILLLPVQYHSHHLSFYNWTNCKYEKAQKHTTSYKNENSCDNQYYSDILYIWFQLSIIIGYHHLIIATNYLSLL